MAPKLPLPDNFFACPRLTTGEVDMLTVVAARTTKQVIKHACVQAKSRIRWSQYSRHHDRGLDTYIGEDPSAPLGVVSCLIQSQIHATLDDVANIHYCANTTKYKEFIRTFFDDKDGIQLYTLARPTTEQPRRYVGVNWAMSNDSGILSRKRDWCYVEVRTRSFVVIPPALIACLVQSHDDAVIDGKRAWVRSLRSIQLSCCPDLRTAKGFIRAEHYRSGVVYVETDVPGVLDVRQLHQVALNGTLSKLYLGRHIALAVSRRRSRCMVTRVQQVLTTIHLSMALKPNATSFLCTLCNGHFRRSHQFCCHCHKNLGRQCTRRGTASLDHTNRNGSSVLCMSCAEHSLLRPPTPSIRKVVLHVGTYDSDMIATSEEQAEDCFDTWISSCSGNLTVNKATKLESLPRESVPSVNDVFLVSLRA
ncbi:hypothetical protein, variant 1 [Aphanomyces invadans]|uniref:FYVE-type domain-containing protein n=1 Tax=Aphanomyces invadans TaxID=157072 RepID=A0A024UKV5_9STRA|nr:hypothetical protein, variant 1 [Aphanomyces invadans]ETW07086.1 hypothetical protein, variant 1 [Aphanomyces invadans]|eukprot:XP_008865161.1 hypothetical protein, variant 1 [Aphanomyces invadans]